MPTTSTTDDITQRLFGELFQEMHVEMNPRQNSSSDKQSTSGTTLEADGVSSESSNMSDCPTPRYHALTPIKYGYLVKQGHNFRNWKVCERVDLLLCLRSDPRYVIFTRSITMGSHFFHPLPQKRLCAVEGNYLYYYVHEDDMAPRGVILLDNCSVRDESWGSFTELLTVSRM